MTDIKLPFANGNHPRSDEEKQQIIENAAKAYEKYMDALGFDWRSDPNSADTPHRVAKAASPWPFEEHSPQSLRHCLGEPHPYPSWWRGSDDIGL